MTIGLLYIALLVVGLAYAVFSVSAGFFSDLFAGDVEVGSDGGLDGGHLHPVSGTTIATFVTGFGAGGVVAIYYLQWSLLRSLGTAVGGGLVLAALAYLVLELIFRQTQAGSEFAMQDVVGREAEVITPIPEGGLGEVAYVVRGQREQGAARTVDGRPAAKGSVVVVDKVMGSTLYVHTRN